ncbi:hypothetical protein [Hymenobacter rubripertinctus]|uniref:Uncharacterized protein n=1 Tax=Hymenobacter rubripertinctus TaxID=2029981 RepID=A0A418R2T6_9BACT|nr:hypothetical protein [Hymenobacter rubripertinctus]RIY11757.1 hypothetical protein D0T11_06240 [Hymenobacter rubripertinctus]
MTDAPQPADTPATTPANEAASMPIELQTPDNTAAGQPVAHDRNHEQNEVAGASRGEFGRQSDQGLTQGGYGNELSRGTATYAGPPVQAAATTGYVGERAQTAAGVPSDENGSFGTEAVGAGQPAGSSVGAAFANDNAAPQGPDSGYADNYGTSSLGGQPNESPRPEPGQRNQHEDYTPGHPEAGPEGLRTGAQPTNATYGADEAAATPPAGEPNGYEAAGSADAQGDEKVGFGSKGGSYNDEYDDARPAQSAGSPARGDYEKQDAAPNYGEASDERTDNPDSPDYGPKSGSPA